MNGITIHLPQVDTEEYVDIELKVNGQKRKYHYRIEILEWEECEVVENKVSCLRDKIQNYDRNWQLVQIGEASNNNIQLLFREKQINIEG